MNKDFVYRLNDVFDNASMADVARRLDMTHATVRNYYLGRLPAPDFLIKIAKETGVSLNWLLTGEGEKYIGNSAPIDLGRFIEEKIAQMIDQRLSGIDPSPAKPKQSSVEFDVSESVKRLNDPERVMSEWFRHEGRKYPSDYGVVFFRGWESFDDDEKVAAVSDAKKVLDRSLKHPK